MYIVIGNGGGSPCFTVIFKLRLDIFKIRIANYTFDFWILLLGTIRQIFFSHNFISNTAAVACLANSQNEIHEI